MRLTHTQPATSLQPLLPLLLISALPQTHAWGTLGHQTVGFLAQRYLSAPTVTWAQTLLSNTNTSYLASVATWADTYRYTSAGTFSAPYHYIDAQDSPPSSCGVDLSRDCGAGGCVVSAIANYTSRIQDSQLSGSAKAEALKFLVHFFGDVTQPLHDEALDVGGNEIAVTFDGVKTNLHHIWDTNMPEKLVGGYALSDAQKWAGQLGAEIDDGDYASVKKGWVDVLSLADVSGSALKMAQDANAFVCSCTLKGGVDQVEGEDLGGDYYKGAVPVVEEQIAKAGYRLAAWLNLIVTGKTGM